MWKYESKSGGDCWRISRLLVPVEADNWCLEVYALFGWLSRRWNALCPGVRMSKASLADKHKFGANPLLKKHNAKRASSK